MRRNLVLIGLMGSGKTTLGQAVGALCGLRFMDTDAEIVNKFNMTIPHIFEQYGESYFRRLETDMVKKAAACTDTIIATGGGVVTQAENMICLQETGYIVYLYCDAATLYQRTRQDDNRPLLAGSDENERFSRLQTLWTQREPLYRQSCDLLLDTAAAPIPKLARFIQEWYCLRE